VETNKLETLLQEHLKADQSRLDRIEVKIDKLQDTVIALTRVEEKLVNLEIDRTEILNTQSRHAEKLDIHEYRLNEGAVTLRAIKALFWLVLSSAAAILVGLSIK
jgi:rubrerythrin